MKRLLQTLGAVPAGAFLATSALAHTGHDTSFALQDGLVHPLHGTDHLVAMVAVGILAFQLGGRALLALPAAFVVLMAVGSVVAFRGIPIEGAELAIIGSLMVLGLAIASRVRLPLVISAAAIGAFGFAHGFAHGADVPPGGWFPAYAVGFLVATSLLHATGMGLARLLSRWVVAPRLLGAAIGLAGVGLAVG